MQQNDKIKETINKINIKLKDNEKFELEINYTEKSYKVVFLPKDQGSNIHFNSIFIIPLTKEVNNKIILESNNMESEDEISVLTQGIETAQKLMNLTKENPSPICIPLLPSYKNQPYHQHLSKESLEIKEQKELNRLDEQVINMIDKFKDTLQDEYGITTNKKIFINGYSSSGVFAQRFSLIHPEIIDTVCIGGASGSIPIITNDLDYPLGIAKFNELFSKEFNSEEYKKINFNYYVGEHELVRLSDDRFTETGQNAPMHDMSYFNKSVDKETGEKQRNLFGKNLFTRSNNIIKLLQSDGVNITQEIIPNRAHNNYKYYKGVNELGDNFVKTIYNQTVTKGNENIL